MFKKTILNIIFLSVFCSVSLLFGGIKIKAASSDTVAKSGDIIKIPIVVDLGELPEKLGSFTAFLTWNPADLSFAAYKSTESTKSATLMVNSKKATGGQLVFALVRPKGLSGKTEILTLEYKILKKQGKIVSPKLQIKSIAAAMNFEDLLPYVDEIKSENEIQINE